MSRRQARIAGIVALSALAAALWLRDRLPEMRLAVELQRAARTADDPRVLPVRIRIDEGAAARLAARLLPTRRPLDAASLLFELADKRHGDIAARALGVACLLAGKPSMAADQFQAIARRDEPYWTNLAAAQIAAAAQRREQDALLAALVATDRALAMAPASPHAIFNRAAILDLVGLPTCARPVWNHYLTLDNVSPWARAARAYRGAPARPVDDDTAWRLATARFPALSPSGLRNLVRRYPQQARTFAESIYISTWAESVAADCGDDAAAVLASLRTIGDELRRWRGESLLFDLVQAIDATSSQDDLRRLAEAVLVYRRGRIAFSRHQAASARLDLSAARDRFAALGSPMAAVAECYAAGGFIDENRLPDGRRRLLALIASERASGSRHAALIALALYELALCDAIEGRWSDSIHRAEESLAGFNRLGERGLAGMVEGLLSQNYQFLDQPELAWQRGSQGIALSCAAGDRYRTRATLAVLSRTEMKQQQWEHVRALVRLEQMVAGRTRDDLLDSGMFLRLAGAEARLGHSADAERALTSAAAAAGRLGDSLREKTLADVDAIRGTILRPSDPARALAPLSSAIAFQRTAQRALLLPELYLERGRANGALRRDADAGADFEEGIRVLEQQRSRTVEDDLRPGVFDNAGELFSEAVSFALKRGDVLAAFGYVERARARSVMEQIASNEGLPPPVPSAASVTSVIGSLPAGGLLIEYAALDDRLAIFVVDRQGVSVTQVPVGREAIGRQVQAFTQAVVQRDADAEIVLRASSLYELLLAPLGDRLAAARNLIVVPDETLQQVPFSALYDRRARLFVIQERIVGAAPSAAVYVASTQRLSRSRRPPVSLVVFANPTRLGDDALLPLPHAEREAAIASSFYPRSTVTVGTRATADAFVDAARVADVVQFSGHAVMRPREPWTSALLFAGQGHDGRLLSAEQIARMRFRSTQVAVLAGCATLRGRRSGVEGLPSVSRAFLVAGVPSVIGTLWDIDDAEAGSIVRNLQKQLAHGMPAAEALRIAQQAALVSDDPDIRHPGNWAAFALLGAAGNER